MLFDSDFNRDISIQSHIKNHQVNAFNQIVASQSSLKSDSQVSEDAIHANIVAKFTGYI